MTGPLRGILLPVLAAERGAVARLSAWSLLEAVPVLASGQLVALAADRGFLAGAPGTGLLFVGCYGLALLAGALGTRQVLGPVARLVESLRDLLVRRVVEATLRQAVDGARPEASAVARTTRQTEAARQLAAGLLMTVRTVAFSLVAVVVGLAGLVPQLAAVVVGALALAGVALRLMSPPLRRRHRAAMVGEERLAEHVGQLLEGLRDISACGAAGRAEADAQRVVAAQAAAQLATARAGAARIAVVVIGARIPLVVALAMAPWLVRSGAATPGDVLGAATYLVTGLDPAVRSVVETMGNMALRLGVLLRLLAERTVPPPPRPAGRGVVRGTELSAHALTFAYGPYSAPVVDRLDLRIGAGDHLAVLGPSGAGKSTLAGLLAGLDRPGAGQVRLGGEPLDRLDPAFLRRTVALVPQESYVFAGSVRENLRYLRPDAGDPELWLAVTLFDAVGTVVRLGGLGGVIERPDDLSQGERQLLVLARVYLSPARVVILDEATCHLDPVSEARAEAVMAARPATTLVVIAHRMSSVRRAPRVLALEGGTAVQGDHAAVAGRSPLYDEMAAG